MCFESEPLRLGQFATDSSGSANDRFTLVRSFSDLSLNDRLWFASAGDIWNIPAISKKNVLDDNLDQKLASQFKRGLTEILIGASFHRASARTARPIASPACPENDSVSRISLRLLRPSHRWKIRS